jgi:hypothetical protein
MICDMRAETEIDVEVTLKKPQQFSLPFAETKTKGLL